MALSLMVYEHVAPAGLIWFGIISAIAAAGVSYWYWVKKDLFTLGIVGVRILFFALLAWCLYLPGRKTTETVQLKPRFVLMVDNSESMLLSPSEDIPNRWVTAMEALKLDWTKTVGMECDIDGYAFNTQVGKKINIEETLVLEADGSSTLLRDAVKKVSGRYGGLNVTAGLLLSDGIDTREAFDEWSLQALPFPIYTLRLEEDDIWEEKPDIRIDTVNTPRRVTVDWETEFKTVVSGQGTKGQPILVQLFKDEALIDQQPTQLSASGGSKEVLFKLEHPDVGIFKYRVYMPPLDGESNTNDNEYAISIQVMDAKNRLLYVEGPPRWDTKFLKRTIMSNKQISPLIFVRGPGGKFMTFGVRGSMTPDMREEQLAFFKHVIIGNLEAEELGSARIANIMKFVENGGSLILLGGQKGWGPKGFLSTPLKKLTPVKKLNPKPLSGEFRVQLSDTGRTHPAFAGDPTLWDDVPPIISVFPNAQLSPGARSLVICQTPQGVQHVVVTHMYGQGKVVCILTDSLWKWQLNPLALDSRPYHRFWNQLISWLSPKEKEIGDKDIDVYIDLEQVFLGEEIAISARHLGDKGNDAPIKCVITMPDKRKVPFSMNQQLVTTASGSFEGFSTKYLTDTPGMHEVIATSMKSGSKVESDSVSFYVKPFSPESVPRPQNFEVLKNIAKASGGKFFENIDELNDELSTLNFTKIEEETSEFKSLWQTWPIIVALMMILTAGWCMRKFRNMP